MSHNFSMQTRELRKLLRELGCVELRQHGSHLVVRCGKCTTVIPVHKGRDIAPGTLRAIVKQIEPCLGKDWLR